MEHMGTNCNHESTLFKTRITLLARLGKCDMFPSIIPSLEACEAALASTKDANVIAMSVLAGGYLSLAEACRYLESLPVDVARVIGVSNRKQAKATFTVASP